MTNQDTENTSAVNIGEQEQLSTDEWNELVFQLLFELEKKYAKFLKNKEVVHVGESENDRIRVSDAYLYLNSLKENVIDSELYKYFLDMAELREKSYLDKFLQPEKRIETFAQTVSKLCQPIISFGKHSKIENKKLTIYLTDEIIENTSKKNTKQFIEKNKNQVAYLKSILLSKVDELAIERDLLNKLKNLKIKKEELDSLLTSYEAEMLSKLISEGKISIIQSKNYLIIKDPEENEQSMSSSLLISPQKGVKDNEK
ncbi:MAG: hypothetical protein ACTSX6_00900 [Candidatus Heimdallarchaeaceae archaeon]